MQFAKVFVLSINSPFAVLKSNLDDVFNVVSMLLIFFYERLLYIHG